MSLFSIKNTVVNVNESTTALNSFMEIEESYFSEAIRFVTESKLEYIENTKRLYRNIYEAGDNLEIVNESFADFFKSIGEAIDRFLKFIKSLFDRFITALAKLFKADSHIKNNKELFSNFSEKHEFDYNGYEYTFEENVPLILAQAEYKDDFFDLQGPETNATACYNKLKAKLRDSYYDRFRSVVLGKGEGSFITSGEYGDEIFRIYRNGCNVSSEFTVTRSVVDNALFRFTSYEDMRKSIVKTRDQIDKEYENIKKYVKNAVRTTSSLNGYADVVVNDTDGTSTNVNVSAEDSKNLNLFIKAKIDQLTEMQNIHALAFGGKLDAIKEEFTQNRNILYKALNNLQKRKAFKEASAEFIQEMVDAKTIERESRKLYDEVKDEFKKADLDVEFVEYQSLVIDKTVTDKSVITSFNILDIADKYVDTSSDDEVTEFMLNVDDILDQLQELNKSTKSCKISVMSNGFDRTVYLEQK